MGYIRRHEIEILLRNYQGIKAMAESLRLELQSVSAESQTDVIESFMFHRNFDALPKGKNTITDKTGNIASRPTKMDTRAEIAREISGELFLFSTVLQKMDIALNTLRPSEKEIIELRYFKNLTWIQIADRTLVSIGSAQRCRAEAMKKITVVSRISIDDYNRLIEILNL